MKLYKRIVAGIVALAVMTSSLTSVVSAEGRADRSARQSAILSGKAGYQTNTSGQTPTGASIPTYMENPFYSLLYYVSGNPNIVVTEGETISIRLNTKGADGTLTAGDALEFSTSTIPALEALWLDDDEIRKKYNWDAYFDTESAEFKKVTEKIRQAFATYIYDPSTEAAIDMDKSLAIDVDNLSELKTLKAMALWVRLKTALNELASYNFDENEIRKALSTVMTMRDTISLFAYCLDVLDDEGSTTPSKPEENNDFGSMIVGGIPTPTVDEKDSAREILTMIYNAARVANNNNSYAITQLTNEVNALNTLYNDSKNILLLKEKIADSGYTSFYADLFTEVVTVCESLQNGETKYASYKGKTIKQVMKTHFTETGLSWNEDAFSLLRYGSFLTTYYTFDEKKDSGLYSQALKLQKGFLESTNADVTDFVASNINSWVIQYNNLLNSTYTTDKPTKSTGFPTVTTYTKGVTEETVEGANKQLIDKRNELASLMLSYTAYSAAYLSFIHENSDALLFELNELVVIYNDLLELSTYFSTTDSQVMRTCEEASAFESLLIKYKGWDDSLKRLRALGTAITRTYDATNASFEAGLTAPRGLDLGTLSSVDEERIKYKLWTADPTSDVVYYRVYTEFTESEIQGKRSENSGYGYGYGGTSPWASFADSYYAYCNGSYKLLSKLDSDEIRHLFYDGDKPSVSNPNAEEEEATVKLMRVASMSKDAAHSLRLWQKLGLDIEVDAVYSSKEGAVGGYNLVDLPVSDIVNITVSAENGKTSSSTITQDTVVLNRDKINYANADMSFKELEDSVSMLAILLNTEDLQALYKVATVKAKETSHFTQMNSGLGLSIPSAYTYTETETGSFGMLQLSSFQSFPNYLFSDDPNKEDIKITIPDPDRPTYSNSTITVVEKDYRICNINRFFDFADTITYALACYDELISKVYGDTNSFASSLTKDERVVLNYYCNDYNDFRDILHMNIGEAHNGAVITGPSGKNNKWSIEQKPGGYVAAEITVPKEIGTAIYAEYNKDFSRNSDSIRTWDGKATNPVHPQYYTLSEADKQALKNTGYSIAVSTDDASEKEKATAKLKDGKANLDYVDIKLMFNSSTRGMHTLCILRVPAKDLKYIPYLDVYGLAFELAYNRDRINGDAVEKEISSAYILDFFPKTNRPASIAGWEIFDPDDETLVTYTEYINEIYVPADGDKLKYGITKYELDKLSDLAGQLCCVINRDVYKERYATMYEVCVNAHLSEYAKTNNVTLTTEADLDKYPDIIDKGEFYDLVYLSMLSEILINTYTIQKLGLDDDCRFVVELDYNYVVDIIDETAEGNQDVKPIAGSITPIIPEYALSEYYEGFSDLPTATEVINTVTLPESTKALLQAIADDKQIENVHSPINTLLRIYCTPTWESRLNTVARNKELSASGPKLGVPAYTMYVNKATDKNSDGKITKEDIDLSYIEDNNALFAPIRTLYRNNDFIQQLGQVTWGTPMGLKTYFSDVSATDYYVGVVGQVTGNVLSYNNARRYTAVQRLCTPIIQFDWTKIDNAISVSNTDSIRVNQSVLNLPVLLWDFDSTVGIRNINQREIGKTSAGEGFYIDAQGYLRNVDNDAYIQENGKSLKYDSKTGAVLLDGTGQAASESSITFYSSASYNNDYHLWLAKKTADNGIRVADWVAGNSLDAVFNQAGLLIESTDTAKGKDSKNSSSDSTKLKDDAATVVEDTIVHSVSKSDGTKTGVFETTGNFRDYTLNKYLRPTDLVYCDLWDCFVPISELIEHQFMYYEVHHEGTNFTCSTAYRQETHTSEYDLAAPSWQADLVVGNRNTASEEDTVFDLCENEEYNAVTDDVREGANIGSRYLPSATAAVTHKTSTGHAAEKYGGWSTVTDVGKSVKENGRFPISKQVAKSLASEKGFSYPNSLGRNFDAICDTVINNGGMLQDFINSWDRATNTFKMMMYDEKTGQCYPQTIENVTEDVIRDVIDAVKESADSYTEEEVRPKETIYHYDSEGNVTSTTEIPAHYILTYIISIPYTVVSAQPYEYTTVESVQVCDDEHKHTVYLYDIENKQGETQYAGTYKYDKVKTYGSAQNPVPWELTDLKQLKDYGGGNTNPSMNTTLPQPSGVNPGSVIDQSYLIKNPDGSIVTKPWPPANDEVFTIPISVTVRTGETKFRYIDVDGNDSYDPWVDIRLETISSEETSETTETSKTVTWGEATEAERQVIERMHKPKETNNSYKLDIAHSSSLLGGDEDLFTGRTRFEPDGNGRGHMISGQQAAESGLGMEGRTAVGFLRQNNDVSNIIQYTTYKDGKKVDLTKDGSINPADWFAVKFGLHVKGATQTDENKNSGSFNSLADKNNGDVQYSRDITGVGYLYNTSTQTFKELGAYSGSTYLQNHFIPGTSLGVYNAGNFSSADGSTDRGVAGYDYGALKVAENGKPIEMEKGTPLTVYNFDYAKNISVPAELGVAAIAMSTNNYTIYEVIDQITKLEVMQKDDVAGDAYSNDEFAHIGTVNPDNQDIFAEKIGTPINSNTMTDGTLPTVTGTPKWQSDSLEAGKTFVVVPEVLMTYKTPPTNADGTLKGIEERGKLAHVYVAGYNPYNLIFPQYNSIDISYKPTTDFISGATATSKEAQTLSNKGINGGKPVVYTGAEVNSILKSNDGTVTYTSWVLDFNNDTASMAWNKSDTESTSAYTTDYAQKQAQNWLDNFVVVDNVTKERKFVLTACANVTFTQNIEANETTTQYKTVDTSSSTKKVSDMPSSTVTIDGTVHRPVTGETVVKYGTAADTTYKEVGAYDIIIRNGRLAGIVIEEVQADNTKKKVLYNLYSNGNITKSTELLAEMKPVVPKTNDITALYNRHRDIAEAIINMQLVEFATTFANQADVSVTTKWDTFKETGIFKDNNDKSVVDEVKDATKDYATEDKDRTEGTWYGEDSTVFRIVKYTTSANLPNEMGITYKIPATYGYKSTADRSQMFKKAVYGWLEVGFKLGNSVGNNYPGVVTVSNTGIADVTDNGDKVYSTAWFDIIGNELLGSKEQLIEPVYQFIISDGSVSNMYN